MHPVLFTVFGFTVYSYGAMLALAFLVAILLTCRAAAKVGIKPETIIDMSLFLCLGGIIGARVLYVLLELGYYRQNPQEIFNLREGGMSFFGGAFAGFGAAWWYVKRKGLNPWVLADLVVPYAALGYAIARVGCLLRGCCYGVPSNLPWALACKEGDPTLRHPTQIYAIIGSLVLFVILLALRKHKRFTGFLFFLYMGLYGIVRGIIEAFRDSQVLFDGIRTTQLACLAVTIFAAIVIWRKESGRRRQEAHLEVQVGDEMGRRA